MKLCYSFVFVYSFVIRYDNKTTCTVVVLLSYLSPKLAG